MFYKTPTKSKGNLGEAGSRGFSPSHGKIVEFDEAKRKRKRDREPPDFYVVVGLPEYEAAQLHSFSLAVDKLCCVRCSNKRCRKRDGSCWEYE